MCTFSNRSSAARHINRGDLKYIAEISAGKHNQGTEHASRTCAGVGTQLQRTRLWYSGSEGTRAAPRIASADNSLFCGVPFY